MLSLVELLKDHPDASCIMLNGNITDCIVSSDLVCREFAVYLHDVLKECGYNNIVFYDFTKASGKYVYDDESAYYSIFNARDAYVTKYGAPPNNASPLKEKKATDKPRGGVRFGQQRKVVGNVEPSQNLGVTSSTTSNNEISYQQRNQESSFFYGELQRFMSDSSIKSAFIFDIHSFLNDDTSRQNIHNILFQWRNPNNLIIFLNPDGKSASRDNEFICILKQSEMFKYFCTETDTGRVEYRNDRCYSISQFKYDEILFSLAKFRVENGLQFPEGIFKAADFIDKAINNQEDQNTFSLRKLNSQIAMYCESKVAPEVDADFFKIIFNQSYSDIKRHPLAVLSGRYGWEMATEQIVDAILSIIIQDNSIVMKTLNDKIEWILKFNKQRESIGYNSIVTNRLNRSTNQMYPSSNELPHILISGNPGTGKTTFVSLIADLFHEVGLLERGHIRKISSREIQAGYVGQTSVRVRELLDECEGGVLCLDEAHNLCKNSDNSGNGNSFVEEAIGVLVNAMTDENRHVLIIFAGYPSENINDKDDQSGVRGVLKLDPGMNDRLKLQLEIDDYTPDVLTKIFFDELENNSMSLGDDLTKSDIANFMAYHYQTRTQRFSNGRFVKEIILKNCISEAKKQGRNVICRSDFGDGSEHLSPVTLDSIEDELSRYPGLGEIGMEIINTSVNLYNNRIGRNITPGSPKHIVLRGKRGTGKTTLAKAITKAFGVAGIMSGRNPVIIENPGSISNDRIKQEIKRAVSENTVLFIDEAHNIREDIVNDLLNPMTEYPNLTCIFAVYPERCEEFLDKDPGLRDRCNTPYEIPDYTPEQLMSIFESMIKQQNCSATNDCLEALSVYFKYIYDTRNSDKYYSNARMVQKVVEAMEAKTPNSIFTADDIPEDIQRIISINKHNYSYKEIMDKFKDYVGWTELKDFLETMNTEIKYSETHPNDLYTLEGNILFVGNPGTGKTKAGKLFAEACYSLGLIKTDRFCAYGSNDLIAGYVGQTGSKTALALQKGADGVILIDEAYNLSYNDASGNADFKREAVDVLLRFCTEQNGRTIIILAGYEDKIKNFLSSNSGLSSRFQTTIHFPDFSDSDCLEILKHNLSKYDLHPDAFEKFDELLHQCMSLPRDWGNARDMEGIANRIISCYKKRIINDSSSVEMILKEDVDNGFAMWINANS